MPYSVTKFGPGTITIGEAVPGPVVDFSCQLINATVEWDKDKDDDVTVLCGETVPGSTTYTASITGSLFQDVGVAAGILEFSWTHKGEVHPFTFTPNTAAATSCEGDLIIDPISFGSDEPKANMQSDFTWDIVGEPTLTPGVVTAESGEPEGSDVAA
jgi:hypothetical protein